MNYIILMDYSPGGLAAQVESYLSMGWHLQGGVSMNSANMFAQAMVRQF